MKPRILRELHNLRSEVEFLREKNRSLQNIQRAAQENTHNNVRKKESEIVRQAFRQTPRIAVQGYNADREITYWNPYSTELYGYSEEEALGRKREELIFPQDMRQEVIESTRKWVEQDIPVEADEHWLLHRDGSFIPVYSQHFMIRNDSEPLEMFSVDVDLRDLKKAEQMLLQARELATIDILTGLKNRNYYRHIIEKYLDSACSSGKKTVFAVIDIDNFKAYNAVYGHQSGDSAIRAIGKIISSCLTRPDDLVVRIGGEEFVVLYSVDQDHDHLGPVRNIMNQISGMRLEHIRNEPEGILTVSSGVVVVEAAGAIDKERVFTQAYAVLDDAKKSGHHSLSQEGYSI